MEVFEAIRHILAARSYPDESAPENVVWRIVEARRADGKRHEASALALRRCGESLRASPVRRFVANRAIHRSSFAGDCRGDRAGDTRSLRREPRRSIIDVDGVFKRTAGNRTYRKLSPILNIALRRR